MCLCEYGDHLRVCGADRLPRATRLARTGSSPRVRSRRRRGRRGDVRRGIISACAEQTQPTHSVAAIAGDHLRVCGADDAVPALSACDSGSSPRVRSRLFADARVGDTRGIISACAEQTTRPTTPIPASKDHLRVCGADDLANILCQKALGSSPRVRSRLLVILHPIYAPRDHLRVCGADSCILLWFGLVGCRGIFDSCTARGRKTTWMPIFGIDALGSRMFLCEISEPSPCAEFWLRLHCVHVR